MEVLKKIEIGKINSETPFEVIGYWWTPLTSQNRVAGLLKFTPGEEITLKLFGHISNSFLEMKSEEVILGVVEGGLQITLHKCSRASTMVGSGHPIEEFSILNCLLGAHFEQAESFKFNKVKIHLLNFYEWLNPNLFKVNLSKTNTGRKIQAEFEPLQTMSFNLKSLKCALSFDSNYSWSAQATRKFHITNDVHNIFQFEESKSLDDLSKFIFRLTSFYSLLIGEPIDVHKVVFVVGKEDIVWLTLKKKQKSRKNIINQFKMIVPFISVQNNFETVIDSWFEKNELLKPVYNLFFSSFFRSDQYVETHFLNMCQSIEVLHRRIFEGKHLPKDEFKKQIKPIKEEISKISNEVLRQKVLSLIGFVNEFGLSDRIEELLKSIPESFKTTYLFDDRFRKDIKDIRNHLTHYEGESNYEFYENNPKALFTRVEQMKIILMYFLLIQLGLTEDQIKNAFDFKFAYVNSYAHHYFGVEKATS